MTRTSGGTAIDCPIGLFLEQEREVARLTQEINRAGTTAQKAPWGQALMEVVDVLLACERYDQQSLSCRLCRNFSELRRKTAVLIVRAGKLSSR